ncbi:MAG: 50S ribosomal protein L2 [Candidatus Komeilibacteria bacterium]|nr:50S ribosomal protein L2 [Candidatus Komeilibacteria bacterium]
MGIKVYNPVTPGRRKMSTLVRENLSKNKPIKKLRHIKKRSGGRNNQGKITMRHIGGGAKRFIREVDWLQNRFDIEARIEAIVYDPNRQADLAQILYRDGRRGYILAADGQKRDDVVISSDKEYKMGVGNRFPLQLIPSGQMVHNIELVPGQGGKIVRSAGTSAVLMVIEGKYAQLKLPSGEIRKIAKEALATVGQVSNPDARNIRWGKAGRKRYLGIKPTVRGKAMNPVDHAHGGGEARNPIGLKHPKTPWGKPALGVKTRKSVKSSNKLIVQRRKKRR